MQEESPYCKNKTESSTVPRSFESRSLALSFMTCYISPIFVFDRSREEIFDSDAHLNDLTVSTGS